MKSWRSSSKVIKTWVVGGCWGRESLKHIKKKNEVLLCVFKNFILCNICLKTYTSGFVCSLYGYIHYIHRLQKEVRAGWVGLHECLQKGVLLYFSVSLGSST